MSFMTRVRLAVVRWWLRNSEGPRSPDFHDLEGFGRTLARPELPQPEALSPPVSVTRKREARFPSRLVIRFE
jgi:hypothetical protein